MRYKKECAILGGIALLTATQFDCGRNITRTFSASADSVESVAYESPETVKNDILEKYFKPDVVEKLKQILLVEGKTFDGYVAHACGRNFLMNCGQAILGYGWGMKTVVADANNIHPDLIVHEYTHHLSALGIVDDTEFENAWQKMCDEPVYKSTTDSIDAEIRRCYPEKLMQIWPKWRTLEREAKLAERLVFKNELVSPEMKNVYVGVLKF